MRSLKYVYLAKGLVLTWLRNSAWENQLAVNKLTVLEVEHQIGN